MNEEMVSVKEEITSLLLSSTAEDSCTVHATVQDTGTVMYTYKRKKSRWRILILKVRLKYYYFDLPIFSTWIKCIF